jgi:hypothetical protein
MNLPVAKAGALRRQARYEGRNEALSRELLSREVLSRDLKENASLRYAALVMSSPERNPPGTA